MQHLTKGQLLLELGRHSGLVPIGIDLTRRQLEWLDLGTYHVYEGFLHKGLNKFGALRRMVGSRVLESFATDLDVLHDQQVVVDPIYPTGFIFHAGRCGSTLLTKVLARDRRHLVIGEADAHNQALFELTKNGKVELTATDENKQFFRHLVLAMGRKRLPGYEAHFIKFTSFNILFFDFIRSVFPDVPALFIYRKPADILASYARNPPGWFDSTINQLLRNSVSDRRKEEGVFGPTESAVAAFLGAGLRAGNNGIRYLNYSTLNASNLRTILKALNVNTTVEQLTTMQSQFAYYSKEENRAAKFIEHTEQKALTVESRCPDFLDEQYAELTKSDLNVVPVEAATH